MSPVIPVSEQDQGIDRSQFRLTTFSEEPACLLFNLDGVDLDPVVERVDCGQASFVCASHYELFYEGRILGPAVLALQDQGMVLVYPVVKAKNWPIIDVEFMEISEKDRAMIRGFLAASS